MSAKFPVRYGRNYKVVLAIVLPCLLIAPFVYAMQCLKPMDEWIVWVIIFLFFGFIALLSVWLIKRVYPLATLTINNNEASLSFNSSKFFGPADFTFKTEDIISFSKHELGGDEYFVFTTRNPSRKFQISASSYEIGDSLLFSEAMCKIEEKVQLRNN